MKIKGVLFLLLVLITLQFASAVTTPIIVQTFSNHDIMVSVLRPGYVYNLIESFHGVSDTDGKFSATLNTNNSDKIDIKVWVKKDNQAIATQKFKGYDVGSPINLEVYPEGYKKPEPVINTSIEENSTSNETVVNNTNETVNDTQAQGSLLTGAAIKEGKSSGKTLYYIIGAIVLLGIIGFTSAVMLRRREYSPKEIKVRKLSEIQKERQEMKGKSAEEYKRAYEAAQKKVEESQKEINKLKNQEKIKQIEDRIAKERDEVNRLRRGY
ncbi:hypothetical protein HY212_02035 [Candidatus Pacearchaeota archaeon]|nr:hypothetical protein [Candidatus Pacearchaeota archaeon]